MAEPSLQAVVAWSDAARGKRLHEQAQLLLSRYSSEDLLYAIFFVLHAYVIEMPLVVRHTINPTWEKGAVQNAAEFASMCTKCGDKIGAALSMVYETGQPIVFVGVGQTYKDIRRMNVQSIVRTLCK